MDCDHVRFELIAGPTPRRHEVYAVTPGGARYPVRTTDVELLGKHCVGPDAGIVRLNMTVIDWRTGQAGNGVDLKTVKP